MSRHTAGRSRRTAPPAVARRRLVAGRPLVAGRRLVAVAAVLGLLAGAGLAVLTTPTAAGAAADPRGEQERADRERAEAAATLEHATERAQEAAASYAAANAALPEAEAWLAETRTQLTVAEVRSRSAQREADQAEEELTVASDRFDDAVSEVEVARDELAGFAVAAYKGSRLTGVNVMLGARGPVDVAERVGYLEHVAGVEQAAIDELTGARLAARQAENEATVAHERAELTARRAAAAVARAQAAEAEAELAADEASTLTETRAEALEVAEAEREASLLRYEEAEAEADRIEQEVREWEARQAAAPAPPPPPEAPPPAAGRRSGAGFVMPTQGWQSSPFGMRFDPFFRVWQLHAGVDIAAPGGAPIRAVKAGTVITAGWSGGYGNYTCLGHGGYRGQGLSTCYAHQSAILVGPGQWVGQGEVIGRVGTTGASTGNHLHFEVRLDGVPTDPVRFLP